MKATKLPSGNWRCRAYDNNTKKCKSFTAPTKKEAEYLAHESFGISYSFLII